MNLSKHNNVLLGGNDEAGKQRKEREAFCGQVNSMLFKERRRQLAGAYGRYHSVTCFFFFFFNRKGKNLFENSLQGSMTFGSSCPCTCMTLGRSLNILAPEWLCERDYRISSRTVLRIKCFNVCQALRRLSGISQPLDRYAWILLLDSAYGIIPLLLHRIPQCDYSPVERY